MKTPKKAFKEKVEHEFGVEDPYYKEEEEVAEDGTVTTKRVKREVPAGISANDASVLKKTKLHAYRLELWFSMCGLNVGWSAVIGIIPLVGSALCAWLAFNTVSMADKIDGGLTNWQKSRMYYNATVTSAVGFIPLVGDIIQAVYKGSTRNAMLLEEILIERGQKNLSAAGDSSKLTSKGTKVDVPPKNHLK
ncbi:hypothetical protein B9G98_04712 [Wickerhamiella sorbophila]|uniref:Uncharacterized protein n=1 Tax=Wickerhamiella sorbophila TaxID=45607 RepID=A0A2T0FQ23_9ASCO|nr:hypothetical protein B9G98_04712 [Wickerhamiella sorbophila]PRT57092.1 hypothetical protein B9G98_04712 [Wickerhamiella sorbophila]